LKIISFVIKVLKNVPRCKCFVWLIMLNWDTGGYPLVSRANASHVSRIAVD
jgi:hypothetical protein